MKRKRIDLETSKEVRRDKEILNQSILNVSKQSNENFFEIGGEATTDVAEAVSILMRKVQWNDPIWDMNIDKKIVYEDITPEKSLFWLSGGNTEWKTLNHYNRPWCYCYLDFQEEFGLLVISIIKRSKTLEDMRKHFIEYLNLPVLYDFALSKKLLR